MSKEPKDVKISKAKGRPMLTWVGKKPLSRVRAYPAQHIESFTSDVPEDALADCDWSDWPAKFPKEGLLFHGDNKDVLAYLLANGFRSKVKLIYIDPPFDSGADYVRKVQLRGNVDEKLEGEDYGFSEQVQYTDIWANDSYLQFMYDRLILLRELLHEKGTIWLHCDASKGHHLRCLMDEVFGEELFRNEVIWFYENKLATGGATFDSFHDSILVYTKSKSWTHHNIKIAVKDVKPQPVTKKIEGKRVWLRDEEGKRLYKESESHRSIGDVWTVPIINPVASERTGFPTQKPEALIERIIQSSSDPEDLVLDSFVGSGTTVVVAQKLGRRWIGCDINKGAIQTTAKRLNTVTHEQATKAAEPEQRRLAEDEDTLPTPCQLSFSTWRVNDYDLQIQHNEAVELVTEYMGITRTRTDNYFDGTLGTDLVKIVPFNHPLTPIDLEDLKSELKRRPEEERDVALVSLGMELAAKKALEDHNRNRPINKIRIIELRTDKRYGGIIRHESMSANVGIKRKGDKILIEVHDVFSPTILQRLDMQEGVFRAKIEDWRAVVDCIMVDTDYDGEVFNVALSDIPARKQDLVEGRYELPAPRKGAAVAVKIIDMLGEETLVTKEV